jgi:hypothetical protein
MEEEAAERKRVEEEKLAELRRMKEEEAKRVEEEIKKA